MTYTRSHPSLIFSLWRLNFYGYNIEIYAIKHIELVVTVNGKYGNIFNDNNFAKINILHIQ